MMDERFARQEICRVGKSLFDRGYVHSSAGNISVRVQGGFLITPTDAVLGFLDPDRISMVSNTGEHISGDRPSKTLALHQCIVQANLPKRPQTSCVIHTHSTHCVALSLRLSKAIKAEAWPELLPAITPYLVMKVGRVPLIRYQRPGDPGVLGEVVRAVEHYVKSPIRAVMLEALGPVVWHDSPAQAMATLEELEESAKLVWMSRGEIEELSAAQLSELTEVFKVSW